jgi:beta-N-acetylhexosaminidase
MRLPAPALLALALLSASCGTAAVATTTTVPPTTSTSGATTLPPPTTLPPTTTTSTLAPTTTTSTAPPVDVPALAHAVLMVGLAGWGVDAGVAAHLAAGGQAIVLLEPNIGTVAQVRSLTNEAACAAAGPILVAVDQELGVIQRLHGLTTHLPSTAEALEMTSLEIELTGQLAGEEMLGMGINVDLAPVLDVVSGPNGALAGRHLGADPEVVAEIGVAFMRGLAQAGVIAVPKHFPGHGRAEADPHYQASRVDASLKDLEAVDFIPFRDAFAAGAQAVMVGHPVYDALDPDLPASISPAVLGLLRDDFGFTGVALTDSLSMTGVAGGRDPGRLAVQALLAGEDLLMVVDSTLVDDTVAAIVAAVATGDLPLARLQEAAARVRALAAAATPITCSP